MARGRSPSASHLMTASCPFLTVSARNFDLKWAGTEIKGQGKNGGKKLLQEPRVERCGQKEKTQKKWCRWCGFSEPPMYHVSQWSVVAFPNEKYISSRKMTVKSRKISGKKWNPKSIESNTHFDFERGGWGEIWAVWQEKMHKWKLTVDCKPNDFAEASGNSVWNLTQVGCCITSLHEMDGEWAILKDLEMWTRNDRSKFTWFTWPYKNEMKLSLEKAKFILFKNKSTFSIWHLQQRKNIPDKQMLQGKFVSKKEPKTFGRDFAFAKIYILLL